jgi:hypothetical protein
MRAAMNKGSLDRKLDRLRSWTIFVKYQDEINEIFHPGVYSAFSRQRIGGDFLGKLLCDGQDWESRWRNSRETEKLFSVHPLGRTEDNIANAHVKATLREDSSIQQDLYWKPSAAIRRRVKFLLRRADVDYKVIA